MAASGERGDLVAGIYDAVLEEGGWQRVPGLFTEALRGESAVVTLGEPDKPVSGVTQGLPAEALRRYAEYFHFVDPWFAAGRLRLPAFRAARAVDLVPEQHFVQTEFYADFAKGFGTVQAVGGHVPFGRSSICTVAVHRDRRTRPFSKVDARRLERLLPHLQRAVQLRRRIGEQGSGFAALDALAIGAVICDGAGRVSFANAAAETLAAAGTGIVLGRAGQGIATLHAEPGKRLTLLISEAAAGGVGGALAISGPGDSRLLVLVAPLPRRFGDEPGRALVILRPADASPTFDDAVLVRLFGLTPAEAKLALALASGRSLAAIATERDLSENTLRSQLAQVLRKTETKSQRDLVWLLSLVPPVR